MDRVEIATSLGKNGLQDWLIQRISAIIIAIYALFLLGYCLMQAPLTYTQWQSLFSVQIMRYASVVTLFALLAHAWIGFWTITTDYIKSLWARLMLQIVVLAGIALCVIWGVQILWK